MSRIIITGMGYGSETYTLTVKDFLAAMKAQGVRIVYPYRRALPDCVQEEPR